MSILARHEILLLQLLSNLDSAHMQMAGLGPKDIDLAQLYDCFTPTVLIELEDLGFCKKGEGGAFVENGAIELGGTIPC